MNKLLKALFCVTFFSVVTRALGFVLKIYLSRRMSTEMLGSYQVAMSVFGVLMTFVSSGIPVVLSRNVSFYHGKKNKKAIGSIVSSGLILTGIICVLVSIIILCFPSLISRFFTSNESMQMLKILLPALIASSIYEVLRGALWGQKRFFAISFTEFLEQVIRIIFIVILFETTICSYSQTDKTALSLSLACIFSAIVVIVIYFKCDGSISSPKLEFKPLLKTSTPITMVRTISSAFSSVIAIIIPMRLMDYGYSSSEALSEFGIIMGMTFPLILIPSTLIGSLAVTVIPSISEQSNNIDNGELKDVRVLREKVNFVVKITVIFATVLIPVFIALGVPIGEILYKNKQAGIYLCSSAILMLPLGISQMTTSVLNAVGLEMKTLKNYVISALFLLVSIWFLPRFVGTYSIIIGYVSMSLVSSILNIVMLRKRKIISFDFIKIILSMILICLFCSVLGVFVSGLINKLSFINNAFISCTVSSSLICLLMAILIYLFNIANLKVIVFDKKLKRA